MLKSLAVAALSLSLLAGSAAEAAADPTPSPTPAPTAAADAFVPVLNPTLTKIRLKVGAGKLKRTRTHAADVASLLAIRGITLGPSDVVRPALTTKITKNLKIVVKRISVRTVTRTESIPAPVVKQKNPKKRRGTNTVIAPGANGSAERTYTITTVNGKVTVKQLVTETVLVQPVTKVVSVGTKGKALNLARLKMWNKIARCESGGNWHINTHNGYYGGLQFALGTWRANGGRDFASYPHKASKAEQITVANRLYAKRGTRPWGCA